MSSLYNAFLLCLLPTSFPMEQSPGLGATRTPRHAGSVVARLARGASRVAAAVARWRQRELLRQELMAMDDHLLADIGVRREEIPFLFTERLRIHTPNPVSPWRASAEVRPLPASTGKSKTGQVGTDKRALAA